MHTVFYVLVASQKLNLTFHINHSLLNLYGYYGDLVTQYTVPLLRLLMIMQDIIIYDDPFYGIISTTFLSNSRGVPYVKNGEACCQVMLTLLDT